MPAVRLHPLLDVGDLHPALEEVQIALLPHEVEEGVVVGNGGQHPLIQIRGAGLGLESGHALRLSSGDQGCLDRLQCRLERLVHGVGFLVVRRPRVAQLDELGHPLVDGGCRYTSRQSFQTFGDHGVAHAHHGLEELLLLGGRQKRHPSQ